MAMTYKIEYISTFYEDILAVNRFLAEYPTKAARIFSKADKNILHLRAMPEMYPVYQGIPAYRIIVVEDYVILYKIRKQERLVEIHRLVYGRMDIPAFVRE
jgi:plasmid stabilization system protein ParE